MPAQTPRQQRAAGADLARIRAGKQPRTFPSEAVAGEFAHKPPGGYSKAQKRSTRGSAPFTPGELMRGYRTLGGGA